MGFCGVCCDQRPYANSGYLYAKTDGVEQGRGYAYFGTENHNGLKFAFNVRLYDTKVGGEPIYGDMFYQWKMCSSGCGYWNEGSDQTVRWTDNSWSGTLHEDTGPPSTASYGRGVLRICEDQSFSPDDCSGWDYSGAKSYSY